MNKLTKVVMLPTEKASQLYFFKNELQIRDDYANVQSASRQHLYFLSDEKIKAGDWYYDTRDKIVSNNTLGITLFSKKIIATTDSSLFVDKQVKIDIKMKDYLPKPSNSFLELYIKEYNKGNQIKEVLVEYEDKGYEDWIRFNFSVWQIGDNYNGKPIWVEDYKLKINKDNTINIKTVNDEDNIEQLANDYYQKFNLSPHHGFQTKKDYLDTYIAGYKAAKQSKKKNSEYEIDFAGHVKAKVMVSENGLTVRMAMNGYGDALDTDKITIQSLSTPTLVEEKSYTRDEVKVFITNAYNNGYEDRDKDIGHGSNLPYSLEQLD